MKSLFFKSSALVVACSLTTPTIYGVHNKLAIHDSEEHALLEACIQNVYTKFEESLDLFEKNLAGLSPKSVEKLITTCNKLKATITQVVKLFIDPIRLEAQQLKGTKLENSNYRRLLHVLLDICAELKKHFDLLHGTLSKSLQNNPTAISVAKNIKPIIDNIITDANFKKIDDYLAQAHNYALSYDIIIEIKPQYRKIINIDNDHDTKTYHIKLAQAFDLIRKALEELRKECRKPAAISQAEMLRIIRSRL